MKFILLIALLIGFAQANTYTKDNTGALVKTQELGNNVYIKENGVLRSYKKPPPTLEDVLAKIDEVQESIERTKKTIDQYDPTIAQATKQELKIRVHTAELSLKETRKIIRIVMAGTQVVSGSYLIAAGIILSQGLTIVTTTTTTVLYSPILGSALIVGGVVYTGVGIYKLYLELKDK